MQRTLQETEVREELCRNMIFNGMEHKKFFLEGLHRCRRQDSYHISLIYCLGISESARNHVNDIYNFTTGEINTKCLQEGWQTSGSARVVRLAFNLYTDATASTYDYEAAEEQLRECRQYAPDELFCCDYAKYFWQAIQLRYPEYCSP